MKRQEIKIIIYTILTKGAGLPGKSGRLRINFPVKRLRLKLILLCSNGPGENWQKTC
jgi:hypothetical protein